jgi:polyphenol oxidase
MSGLEPLQDTALAALPGVRHGFFTRRGGVSTGLYDSLNLGAGSNDAPEAVAGNRARVAVWFGRPPEALSVCYQIHSAAVVVATSGFGADRPEADGVVTAQAGVICGALAADCAPVLLADAEARVVAAVHAGWRGALAGVTDAAIAAMTGLGARRDRIVAAVGPCIGPESYEVGLEFRDAFLAVSAASERFFRPGAAPDKRLFDLPGYVVERLRAAGLAHCAWIGRDTCADEAHFFSNRRAFKRGEADYGRLISAIMLEG